VRQVGVSLCIVMGLIFSFGGTCLAQEGAATRPSDVALEIEALRTLDDLQATAPQVHQLIDACAGAAGETKTADTDAIDSAANDDRATYMVLLRLREGLISGDDARIEQDEKELSDLEEKSQVNFSPRITGSLPARTAAEKIVRLFSAQQIAALIAQRNEEISDPTEILVAALSQCRGMKLADFQAFNTDVSEEIADLVAGVTVRPNRSVQMRTAALMRTAFHMQQEDYDAQLPDLQDRAKNLTKVAASMALRHWVQWEIVQLLSNPQLDLALTERSSWGTETSSTSQESP